MSSTRIYVSSTLSGLAAMMGSGGVGPPPFLAHAVTDRLREAHPRGDEEELEHAALTAAAQQSLGMLTDQDVPRRLVLALDVPSVIPVREGEPSLVEVQEVVPTTKLAACHVDAEDAEPVVRAAATAWPDAEAGDAEARRLVDRCVEHELGWFATQEIGELLDRFGRP